MLPIVVPFNGDWNADTDPHSNFKNNLLSFTYNRFGILDITKLEVIERGLKYVVYLSVYPDMFEYSEQGDFIPMYPLFKRPNTGHGHVVMPERVWQDSQNGLVHWIIDWSTEAFSYETIDFTGLHGLLRALNVRHSSQVTYLTGAKIDDKYGDANHVEQVTKTGINFLHANTLIGSCFAYDNWYEYSIEYAKKKVSDIYNRKINRFKSVCYNRIIRPHRMIILSHMRNKGYLSESIHSMGGHPNRQQGYLYNQSNEFDYLINDLDYLNQYDGFITPVIEEQDINLDENQANTICYPHGYESYFSITTETVPEINEDIVFITEKSYKPFLMMQPFIQFGNYKNVDALRDMGYRTFDKWIDHSYDNEHDKIKRMKLFLKELDRLHSMSNEDWSEMLVEMIPDLLHNNEMVRRQMNNFESATTLVPILFDHFR